MAVSINVHKLSSCSATEAGGTVWIDLETIEGSEVSVFLLQESQIDELEQSLKEARRLLQKEKARGR